MSKIEWTGVTWNPVRGCSRVSEGCRNCYAERIAARFSRSKGFVIEPSAERRRGRSSAPARRPCGELIPSKLDEPLRWRKPRRVFVNSMSDLFHEGLPDAAIDCVFAVMALAQQHTFQILTKRPERMKAYVAALPDRDVPASLAIERVPGDWGPCAGVTIESLIGAGPLPNVWLGVSCEDQATADERIPLLLQTPAAVRFVSYEPALGPVDFRPWLPFTDPVYPHGLLGTGRPEHNLSWVICGGESGPGARPMDVAWVRSVVRQCREAGVARIREAARGTAGRVPLRERGGLHASGLRQPDATAQASEGRRPGRVAQGSPREGVPPMKRPKVDRFCIRCLRPMKPAERIEMGWSVRTGKIAVCSVECRDKWNINR